MTEVLGRTEWRGDYFVADMPEITDALMTDYQMIHFSDLSQTATVFFSHDGLIGGPYRARGYGNPSANPNSLEGLNIDWGLERKYDGSKDLLGKVAIGALRYEGVLLAPYSVRIADRDHFAPNDCQAGVDRITVDKKRNVYTIEHGDRLRFLGDLGPRVEVKASTSDAAKEVVEKTCLSDSAFLVPDRSLEFVLSDMVRSSIPYLTFGEGLAETEFKFTVCGENFSSKEALDTIRAFVEQSDQLDFLLPGTPDIQRLRRLHICYSGADIVTIVETPAGRLSTKLKSDTQELASGILLRNTQASYSMDTTGLSMYPVEYIAAHHLKKAAEFTKHQRMIFLTLNDAFETCLRITFDDCEASNGATLRQIEIEFAGSRNFPSPEIEVRRAISGTALLLQKWFAHHNQDVYVAPSFVDKASYFIANS